jgi:CRISPR-associated endonuclease Csn1
MWIFVHGTLIISGLAEKDFLSQLGHANTMTLKNSSRSNLSTTVLGLDIGSNSVGWALLNEHDAKIIATGVRIFPEGVDRDTSGAEHSKNEGRRIARGQRRQIARRARRKSVLRRSLVQAGLLPAKAEELAEVIALDPYGLRRKGLTERLEPFEFGRVLMHLGQRRGFLSNRKADKGKQKENSETLQKISELAARMGTKTLGEYFANRRDSAHGGSPLEPVRGQHTRRQMYEEEFNRLWEAQVLHHPQMLTEVLRYGRHGIQSYPRKPAKLLGRKQNSLLAEFGLHGILFFQRSLYWPKSVIGECELEPKQKRCEKADRRAQLFRLYQEVNNLRVIPRIGPERPLTAEEREVAIKTLLAKKEVEFDALREALKLIDGENFNLEAGNRKKLLGMPVDALLSHKDLFGKAWAKKDENEKNSIVRLLIDGEEEEIVDAAPGWGCTPEVAARLVDVNLPDGYASVSLMAIEKLLPHLERGLRFMGNDASDSALHAAGYLRNDQKVIGQSRLLPSVPDDILNPLVKKALHEVRRVVNSIIREYGKPDAIHIELAREVQGGIEQRAKASRAMRERERLREKAAEFIEELGEKPTRSKINRYLLWKEQGGHCLYSGEPISPQQLFGGEVDIDHILPYSRSLDDSMANKAVCFVKENRQKGNQTPHEWLANANPKKFHEILQRCESLPYPARMGKKKKCQAEAIQLDEFIARQLTDTAYITKKVREFVMCLGCDVVCSKGQLTAELRHQWGLNTILRTDDENLKSRADHRHHAVDAIVIALLDRSRLQQLARCRHNEPLPEPGSGFREVVQKHIEAIHVSHRPSRKVSGELHEGTIYGPTSKPQRNSGGERPHAQGWIENEGEFVYRKPLDALKPAMIEKIRDPRVKELVLERLAFHQLDVSKISKIPKEVWTIPGPLKMVGRGKRANAEKANVIKTVRLIKPELTIRPIRGGTAYVKPGNTHHICLFELPGSTPAKPKRDLVAVTMMEASVRVRSGQPLVSRVHPSVPEARFLFSLCTGDVIEATIKNQTGLFVYRTAASTTQQMTFVTETDARPSATYAKFTAYPNSLVAKKVTVDYLGRVRDAND